MTSLERQPASRGTAPARGRLGVGLVLALLSLPVLPSWAADPSTQNAQALHEAVRSGDVGYLKDLLVNGDPALVGATVGRGSTPLHVAASLNLAEVAELLLDHGATVDSRTEGGFSPLHWAAGRDAAEVARLLIAHGADIEAESAAGIRPLHWAATRNATRVIELLLAAGASPTAESKSGATPLHWAYMGKSEAAALLIAERIVTLDMEAEGTNALATLPGEADAQPPAAPTADSDDALMADAEGTNAPATLPGAADAQPTAAPTADSNDALMAEYAALVPAVNTGALAAAEATDIYISREGSSLGKALIVSIGIGETLVFEWIPALKLWAGKYEVTNGQYRRFRPAHSSGAREKITLDGNDQPVVSINWHEAQAYCEWLNRTYRDRLPKGFVFRLPYAVEWTLLARCGEKRIYPWGNAWPPAYGNFSDLTAREQLASWNGISGYVDGFAVSCPVSQSGMNEWGIYGMGGNVWEWCLDDYPNDPRYKVRRSGSWDFDPEPSLRLSMLGFDRPDVRDDTIGFRIVASMPPADRR